MRRFASKTAKKANKYEKNSRRQARWPRGRRTVSWIHGRLVFCGIADETLVTGKSHIRGGGSITLCSGISIEEVSDSRTTDDRLQ